MSDTQVQAVMRGLIKVWTDFSSDLDTVPLIDKLLRGKFRLDDYRQLLINHRQQVIEGSRWIARAASSVTSDYAEQRSLFSNMLLPNIAITRCSKIISFPSAGNLKIS